MLRAMMLTLTLILITLTAAYLGKDEQLTQVLYRTKTPVQSSSAVESAPESKSAPAESSSSQAEHPRFVMDEPLSMPPVPPEGVDDGQSSQPDISQAQAVEGEEQYQLPAPTEQQKMDAAEPYVKELFELKESAVRELKKIVDEALTEYLLTAPDIRNDKIPQMVEKYIPRAQKLEQDTDAQAETILLKMSAALAAIGADDGLVEDSRAAYQRSKEEQMAHYSGMFSSMPS